jgi:exodeoxyribonuclease-3
LAAGFTDTFRFLNPTTADVYTWWAQRAKTSKINNAGWRIDYYLTSARLNDHLESLSVIDSGPRQDHAPIELVLRDFSLD